MELVEGTTTVDGVDGFVAQLGAIGDEHGVAVQAFDARYVVDRAHLERAVELTDRAIARDDAIARDRSVEILLYAAGRRQINRALEMGVGTGDQRVVVVVHGSEADGHEQGGADREGGTPNERAGTREQNAADAVSELLDPAETLGTCETERVREFFDVGDAELDATDGDLADLVRERVALLTVEK
jgi:KEOPS complex subunit Cgi121